MTENATMKTMKYYLVGVNKVVSKQHELFTYHSENDYPIGQIVQVPIGKNLALGVIFEIVAKPEFVTKPIFATVADQALPLPLVKTLSWMRQFYLAPLASIIQTALPTGILKNRRTSQIIFAKSNPEKPLTPTAAQAAVITKISSSPPQTHLLRGITGSGKTTVYIELAKKTITSGRSVIIIIPEIALTAQLTQQFANQFSEVILFHSNLTESARHQIWQSCLKSSKPLVIIGTRSSLFLPIANLGLIIIDEQHEISSLRQDKNPKYSSSQLASILAKNHQAHLLLGSATPLITDYWICEQKKCSILELTETALKTTTPDIQLVDIRQKANFNRSQIISNQLLTAIKHSLSRHQQILIFHNRRGSTSATFCKQCGWIAECPNCHIPLTLHHDNFKLHCHACNYHQPTPTKCPICQSAEIEHRGIGTKLIEADLRRLFPQANIRRFDADTPNDQNVANSYDQLRNGNIDILIGTQVIAKGLNLPNLTTVGVIQADVGLSLPDFTANERTFQLLTQVIGRVGRNQNQTRVIVQTYQPDNPSIKLALAQNYTDFYQREIDLRRKNNYPPFCFLLKLTVAYKTEAVAIKHARALAAQLRRQFADIEIIGPSPSFYEKRGTKFYWQIIVKSTKRPSLQQIVAELPPNWQFDLDAVSLL